jgi:hypothetical protein
MRENHTFFVLALSMTLFICISPLKAQVEWVNINGTATYNGEPVCTQVLANGQSMFTCSGDGGFNLVVPLNEQGEIVVYCFCSGRAPWRQTINPEDGVAMQIELGDDAGGQELDVASTLQSIVAGGVRVSGTVSYNGLPVCSMVLANGQYMFTCSGDGSFSLDVPLDDNGGITLYSFCSGRPPYKEIFTKEQINSINDGSNLVYADDYTTCVAEDTYDEGKITCYVDSANGNDENDGLSEEFPVKSQSAIDSSCTIVRFKRGSVFNEKLYIPTPFNGGGWVGNVKVFTNYGPESDPLPHFRVSSEPGRGPVVLSFYSLTIDGLHLSGARGDNTMEHDFDNDGDGITKGIVGGIGAFLGGATTFINNEINDCDIGIMLGGQGSVVRGNYVHDLIMGIDEEPGVDPNLVGGAEGIFVNASNCEVSYNTFINCTGPADWVGANGECDGGATEVSATSGGTIQNVHIHHNFSYNNCGFFEVASYFGDEGKGLFRNSSLHNNVTIDSAWMGLLQVNNTDLDNIHFYNNTLVQRPGSLNEGILWIIFTAESSGMQGGRLVPGTVHLTNNLFVLDGVSPWGQLINPAFDTHNNIVLSYSGPEDPNYVDLGFADIAGIDAKDFDLVDPLSPAVDAGAYIAGNTLDFFNRTRPVGSSSDIGALELGAAQEECIPRFPTP